MGCNYMELVCCSYFIEYRDWHAIMEGPITDEERHHIGLIRLLAEKGSRTKVPKKYADSVRWIAKAPSDESAVKHYRRAMEASGGGFGSWVASKAADLHSKVKAAAAKVASTASKVATAVKNVVSGATGPLRLDYPPTVRNLLSAIGQHTVRHILVGRAALGAPMQKVLNLISLGKWNQVKASMPYDDIFHLFIVATLDDDSQYLIEKNEVIDIRPYTGEESKRKFFETHPIQILQPFTLDTMLQNTERYMTPQRYFVYNAWNNNCQVFVSSVMKANASKGLIAYNQNLDEWVKQNTDQITTGMGPLIQRLGNTVTNMAHRFNIMVHGRGFDPVHVLRLHHWSSNPTLDKLDKLGKGEIKVMQHMFKLLPAHMRTKHVQAIIEATTPEEAKKAIRSSDLSGGVPNITGHTYDIHELINSFREDKQQKSAASRDFDPEDDNPVRFVDTKGVAGSQKVRGLLSSMPVHAMVALDRRLFNGSTPRVNYWWTDPTETHIDVHVNPDEVFRSAEAINGKLTGGALVHLNNPDRPAALIVAPNVGAMSGLEGSWLPDDLLSGLTSTEEESGIIDPRAQSDIRSNLVSGDTTSIPNSGYMNVIMSPDASDQGGGFLGWLASKARGAWHGITHVADKVGSAVTNLGKDALGVAKDVYSKGKEVYDTAKDVVQKVTSAIPAPIKDFVSNVVLPAVAPEAYLADEAVSAATGVDPINDLLGTNDNNNNEDDEPPPSPAPSPPPAPAPNPPTPPPSPKKPTSAPARPSAPLAALPLASSAVVPARTTDEVARAVRAALQKYTAPAPHPWADSIPPSTTMGYPEPDYAPQFPPPPRYYHPYAYAPPPPPPPPSPYYSGYYY